MAPSHPCLGYSHPCVICSHPVPDWSMWPTAYSRNDGRWLPRLLGYQRLHLRLGYPGTPPSICICICSLSFLGSLALGKARCYVVSSPMVKNWSLQPPATKEQKRTDNHVNELGSTLFQPQWNLGSIVALAQQLSSNPVRGSEPELPRKPHEIINICSCKLLNILGVICYTAIDNPSTHTHSLPHTYTCIVLVWVI